MMNLLRRVASVPGLRAVLLRPAVRRRLAGVLALRFLLAARAVTTPWAYVRRELTARGVTSTYRLRSGGRIGVQHGRDGETLYEIFARREYEPPPAIAARLTDRGVRRVLDVGANVGLYAAWVTSRWPAAHIVCFEPSPESLPLLRDWAATSGADVEIVAAAARAEAGSLPFVTGRGGGAHAGKAADPELGSRSAVTMVPAVDLFDWLPAADLVKIDIEGGEWELLADPRLRELDRLTLVMEYHRHLAPRLPALAAATEFLEGAGFTVGDARPNHWGHGILWATKG